MKLPMARRFHPAGTQPGSDLALFVDMSRHAKSLQILLSAYACEPGLGSEAAVGWNWATGLARAGCQVHVITRASNRARIEAHLAHAPQANLRFSYFDLPRWARFWKRANRGVHLYYLLWQVGAFLLARRLVKQTRFDLVHHVSFVTARFPSFMGLLGLPFFFGPLAGGEYAPSALWRGLGWRSALKESGRYLSMCWWRFSPLLNLSFATADRIFATSLETLHRLPRHAQGKAQVMLGIGLDDGATQASRSSRENQNAQMRVLYAGHFLSLKGMDFGLQAFGRLTRENPDTSLTMLGHGHCEARWCALADRCGVADKVTWVAQMPRAEFMQCLPNFDVLLFPSLHDSGGMVVLEAMAAGVPVVCLDYGGPAVLVDASCGFKVRARTPDEAVSGLHRALATLAADPALRARMGQAARIRAGEFAWDKRVAKMLECYRECV